VPSRKVSDRTFLLHLGGKIEVRSKVQLRSRGDLLRVAGVSTCTATGSRQAARTG